MKLWFEGWNVNAQHACPGLDPGRVPVRAKETHQKDKATPAAIAAPKGAINGPINMLAVNRLRGDSAANNLFLKM